MDTDQLQTLLQQGNQSVNDQTANLPNVENTARTQLFGSDPTLDSINQAESGKLTQLYQHDKDLAMKYASGKFGIPDTTNQAPPSGGVDNTGQTQAQINDPSIGWKGILNPYSAEVYRADQSIDTSNELGELQTQAQKRRDVLGNSLDKILKLAQSHIDLQKNLNDQTQASINNKSDNLKNLLSVLQVTGGNITPDMAAQLGDTTLAGKHIPGTLELKSADSANTASGEAATRLTKDVAAGTTYTDLYNRYAAELPASQIREAYNAGPMAKRYGAAKEDDMTLLSNYNQGKKGSSASTSKRAEYSAAAQSIRDEINRIPLDKYAGPAAQSALQKSNLPLSIGTYMMTPNEKVSANLKTLLDSYFTTAVSTLSARGATAPDLKALEGLKPNITDDPTVLQNKLNSINVLVATKTGAGAASTASGNSNSGVNRQDVISKLKSAGYNDNDIHAYLKAKGIDK